MSKVFLAIIIFFLSLSVLLIIKASKTETSIVLLPSEVLSSKELNRNLRVAGKVSTSKIDYTLEPNHLLKFEIQNPKKEGRKLKVIYKGLKPDMFAPGRDVILDGKLEGDTFIASKLLTQCPSKYEPPKPEEE